MAGRRPPARCRRPIGDASGGPPGDIGGGDWQPQPKKKGFFKRLFGS
jgi:hypothetical protein